MKKIIFTLLCFSFIATTAFSQFNFGVGLSYLDRLGVQLRADLPLIDGFDVEPKLSYYIVDDATKIVDVEFRITPGQKSMVRRINIVGNDNTNDEVYRRELRQFESSLHDNAKIERSKIRLQRLKFVENVSIEKTRVSNSSDLVDITYKIKEVENQ